MAELPDDPLAKAKLAKREGRFNDARLALQHVIDTLRQEQPGVSLADALRLLGEVERKLRNNPAARQHYEEAVAIYRRSGDPVTLAHTLRHLGDVLFEGGDAQSAEPCYREALDLYRSNPEASSLDLANAIRSMAVLKAETGSPEESRRLWEEARGLYAALDIGDGVKESTARLAALAGR